MASLLANITNFANQSMVLQLPNGETADLVLVFDATSERWVIDVSYSNTIIKGKGLCCYPNVLRQWRKVIPFGLACTTRDQTDPFTVNDFVTGRVGLFLLTAEDVLAVEATVFGGAQA